MTHKYNGSFEWSGFPHEGLESLKKGNATGTIFQYKENGTTNDLQIINYNGQYAAVVEEYYASQDYGVLYFDFDTKIATPK